MNQFSGIIIKPKAALQSLPNDTILISSIAIIAVLGISGILQRALVMENKDMIVVASAMGFFMGMLITFIVAYILSVVIQFFGVKVSFSKTINIIGFVQVPKLIFSLFVTVFYFTFPTLLSNSSYNQTANLIMILISVYSLILMVYGINLEHSSNKNELQNITTG